MSALGDALTRRFTRGDTDADLMARARLIEEFAALAYDTAARGALAGSTPVPAAEFAAHERAHGSALASMQLAFTVPVVRRAVQADVDALLPGLGTVGRGEALRSLVALEEAAIAGQVELARSLRSLRPLRTVGMVAAGGAQHLAVLRAALGEPGAPGALGTGS